MFATELTGKSLKLASYLLVYSLAIVMTGCGGSSNSNDVVEETATESERPFEIVARTGPVVAVRVGETAYLSDNNSYSSSTEPLRYRWSFSARPETSNASLRNASSPNPSFVADARGTYAVQLIVSAGGASSRRAIQLVLATIAPERLTGPVFHQGLSSSCILCHNDEFETIPPKSQNHVATSNVCESCHTPFGWTETPAVDHQEVFGNCSECHNGLQAIGKSQFHVDTVLECDNCHNTSSFFTLRADGSFDHSGISSGCAGCHNGIAAIGKTPTPPHPDTAVECIFCHTTSSFQNAFPDHDGPLVVGNRCDSCHGVDASGQSTGHPSTSVDCGTCHNTGSFSLGGFFDHSVIDPVAQPCAACHNDNNSINAIGKTPTPPHPATGEDCGFCHDTQDFANAFIDHSDPAVLAARCDSCHGVSATGKSANHMPTTADCGVCHTPGNFGSGQYDHAGETGNCVNCHDDVIQTGKPPFHLPTIQDCVVCHTTSVFVPTIFDHVGITTDCASCHDGNHDNKGAFGKPLNHLPTSQDCALCHLTTGFAGATFDHAGIVDNCVACHDSGIATAKKSSHIPTANDCSLCHDSTLDFQSTSFLGAVHPGIARGCEGCHNPSIFPADPALTKAPGHLPTDQDCYLCHTTAGFQPDIFDHVGIAGNCESCHDGSFVAVGANARPVDHIATTQDCGSCHDTDAFAPAFVDHGGPEVIGRRCDSCHDGIVAIGKNAKPDHVVTSEDCNVCHVPGTFAPAIFDHRGIVDNCASCHDGNVATGLSVGHVPILPTQDCSVCHNTTAFAGAHFDHDGISANCASCHDGNTAGGKHNDHVPTNGDCIECHLTTGFLPASFDHAGIVDNCLSCHDGVFASGKSVDHVYTLEDCGVCHNTQGFVPATFDHSGIVDNCASCHGITATGMDADHIPTGLDCSFCHTTASFADGSWDHQGITGNCSSCHDGTIATGKGGEHFTTTQECDACHSTLGWGPIDYQHQASGDYPGDHRRNLGCTDCHTGNDENISYPRQAYAGSCAGCHAGEYKRDPHKKTENPKIFYSVDELQDCSGACHMYTNSSFTTIKKTRNSEHRTRDDEF